MSNLPNCRIVNRTRETIIADHVEIADCFWKRARGLIGRREIPNGFGLVIRLCNAIHMLFMSMDLDVVHVDTSGRVVRILHEIKPWRLGPIVWKSAWVIELPGGTARATGTKVGDLVELVERSGNERSFSSGRLPRDLPR